VVLKLAWDVYSIDSRHTHTHTPRRTHACTHTFFDEVLNLILSYYVPAVKREIKLLRLLMHPYIIRLYEVVHTPAYIYVVMEYVKKGELFDYIVEKGRLHEQEACRLFQQVASIE
jgi:serine/threonine protein kinase